MLLTALIFSGPPRAWMFFAMISSAVCAVSDEAASARAAATCRVTDRTMRTPFMEGRAYDAKKYDAGGSKFSVQCHPVIQGRGWPVEEPVEGMGSVLKRCIVRRHAMSDSVLGSIDHR